MNSICLLGAHFPRPNNATLPILFSLHILLFSGWVNIIQKQFSDYLPWHPSGGLISGHWTLPADLHALDTGITGTYLTHKYVALLWGSLQMTRRHWNPANSVQRDQHCVKSSSQCVWTQRWAIISQRGGLVIIGTSIVHWSWQIIEFLWSWINVFLQFKSHAHPASDLSV